MSRQDSEEMRAHIACCEDCAGALAALRATTTLIADTGEIEPPAYLLEQILAATTERPTLRERLTGAFGRLTLTPAPVRWAAASAAVILVTLAALNNVSMIKTPVKTPVAVNSPSPTQPLPVVAAQPMQEPATAANPSQTVRAAVRRVYSHRRSSATVAKANNHTANTLGKPKMQAVADVPTPIEEQSPTNEDSSPTTVATTPVPTEEKEIKVAGTPSEQADTVKRNEDALADLRAKLAARNKHRRYQVQADPVQVQKVTIELASIKF